MPSLSLRSSGVISISLALALSGCGDSQEPVELLIGGSTGGSGSSSGQVGTPGDVNAAGGSGSTDNGASSGGEAGGQSAGKATGSASSSGGDDPVVVTTEPEGPLTINIEISAENQQILEAAPWSAPDVSGAFVDGGGLRFEEIEVNYRGAYQLNNLIRFGDLRNWKLKFKKSEPYLGLREWNLNYEPHLRQEMAYALLNAADVRLPDAEHVLLQVNGESQGVYLRYPDPDNKAWLHGEFGSDKGDLFKAAYDIPNEDAFFGTMEALGTTDEDYFLHFNKKLNNNGEAAADFSSLREFIGGLNETPDADFAVWLSANFDVERFTSYLVVSNFMCNWDSYPHRPKNYWLYQHPESKIWSYIPWDLDGTFQVERDFNYPFPMDSSIFKEFDQFEGLSSAAEAEGTERPLVRRMMAVPVFRDAYVARYRELLSDILSESNLKSRAQGMQDLLSSYAPQNDQEDLAEEYELLVQFIGTRFLAVTTELSNL